MTALSFEFDIDYTNTSTRRSMQPGKTRIFPYLYFDQGACWAVFSGQHV